MNDTQIANRWANLYREGGTVDYDGAVEVLYDSPDFKALCPLLLQYLQQEDSRDEVAMMIAETLADFVRDSMELAPADMEESEDIELEPWEHQESEKLEEYREW